MNRWAAAEPSSGEGTQTLPALSYGLCCSLAPAGTCCLGRWPTTTGCWPSRGCRRRARRRCSASSTRWESRKPGRVGRMLLGRHVGAEGSRAATAPGDGEKVATRKGRWRSPFGRYHTRTAVKFRSYFCLAQRQLPRGTADRQAGTSALSLRRYWLARRAATSQAKASMPCRATMRKT